MTAFIGFWGDFIALWLIRSIRNKKEGFILCRSLVLHLCIAICRVCVSVRYHTNFKLSKFLCSCKSAAIPWFISIFTHITFTIEGRRHYIDFKCTNYFLWVLKQIIYKRSPKPVTNRKPIFYEFSICSFPNKIQSQMLFLLLFPVSNISNRIVEAKTRHYMIFLQQYTYCCNYSSKLTKIFKFNVKVSIECEIM